MRRYFVFEEVKHEEHIAVADYCAVIEAANILECFSFESPCKTRMEVVYGAWMREAILEKPRGIGWFSATYLCIIGSEPACFFKRL